MSDPSRGRERARKHLRGYRFVPLTLLVCLGVGASILGFCLVRVWEEEQLRKDFHRAAEDRVSALERDIGSDLLVLEALHSLYAGSHTVERSEFAVFVKPFLTHHGAIQALEWIPRVPDSQRAAYEEAARNEGFPQFQITERHSQGQMIRAPRREEYFPVYFVGPYEGNEVAHGFDLGSNPTRLEALNRSRDSGEMVATARITLVQEKGRQFGFLLFLPVYRKGAPTDSVDDRRRNLEGFVLGVYRIADIVEEALRHLEPQGVDVHLYDSSAATGERFLHFHSSRTRESPGAPSIDETLSPQSGLHFDEIVELADRKWLVRCTPTPGFIAAASTLQPWGILAGGLTFSGFLAAYILSILLHGGRARRTALQLEQANEELKNEVAERNRAEEAVRGSERKFRSLVEQLPNTVTYIADLDERSTTRYISPQVEAVLGYSPDDFMADPDIWATCVHPEDRERVLAEVALCHATGTDYSSEYRMVRRDGSVIWWHDEARIVRDDHDQPLYLLGVNTDITERKKAEEEIGRLARFPSENPNPVLRVSMEGTVIYANKGSRRLLDTWGCEPGQSLPERFRQLARDVLASGASRETEVQCDGQILSITFAPLVEADCVNLYGLDITERKRAEEELKATLQEVAHFNRLMMTREERVMELKKEVNDLLKEMGRERTYETTA